MNEANFVFRYRATLCWGEGSHQVSTQEGETPELAMQKAQDNATPHSQSVWGVDAPLKITMSKMTYRPADGVIFIGGKPRGLVYPIP